MDPATSVAPLYVAGPLRLSPFPALRLAASRVADPGLARTFARPYRAVPERLAAWERRGLLIRDGEPALYLHEYTTGDVTIRGLVGALDISRRAHRAEERAVLPHEAVYPAQADDLAERMDQMRLNPAPILLVQHSPAELRALLASIRGRLPEHQYVDRGGSGHRLWAVRDSASLGAVAAALAPTTCLIADGHHRYAAYLRLYRRDQSEATRSGLAMLVDQDDTPLRLGAIHRVLMGTTYDDVLAAAELVDWPVEAAPPSKPPPSPVTVSPAPGQRDIGPASREVTVTDGHRRAVITAPVGADTTTVELVHLELLPALSYGPSRIRYHHRAVDATDAAVASAGVALLMPPPSLDEVLATARAGRLLPEKATSFQPKPPLGSLLRALPGG